MNLWHSVSTNEFKELGIEPEILKALTEMGFKNPSPIQKQAIPLLLDGKDLIGQAQTGTGKTAAFAIPIIQNSDVHEKNLSTVILCPTRELVIQVAEEIRKIMKYRPGLQVASVYGGQEIGKQLQALRKNPQIVVGTPGRFMDHMRRKTIRMGHVKNVVLDEADEMLDMGFRDDMEVILKDAPTERQTIMFSATMSPAIKNLMQKYLKSPVIINTSASGNKKDPDIKQFFAVVPEKKRAEAIIRLIDFYSVTQALVFCNTRAQADEISEYLRKRRMAAGALHGDMNQKQRDKVMGAFRSGDLRILVATDVAGRGIDVGNIEAVFNLDLPRDEEDYVHRIGRTGRAGRSGMAISFINFSGASRINRLSRNIGKSIAQCKIPEVQELAASKAQNMIPKIKSTAHNGNLSEYLQMVNALAGENFSPEIIAASLLYLTLMKENDIYRRDVNFLEENAFTLSQDTQSSANFGKKSHSKRKDYHQKGKFRNNQPHKKKNRNKK